MESKPPWNIGPQGGTVPRANTIAVTPASASTAGQRRVVTEHVELPRDVGTRTEHAALESQPVDEVPPRQLQARQVGARLVVGGADHLEPPSASRPDPFAFVRVVVPVAARGSRPRRRRTGSRHRARRAGGAWRRMSSAERWKPIRGDAGPVERVELIDRRPCVFHHTGSTWKCGDEMEDVRRCRPTKLSVKVVKACDVCDDATYRPRPPMTPTSCGAAYDATTATSWSVACSTRRAGRGRRPPRRLAARTSPGPSR